MEWSFEIEYNSPVILSYLLLSLIACFCNKITKDKSNKLLFSCYRSSPWNPLTYIRLVTHAIGHSDFTHLTHNFLIILLIGPMIEEKYGSIPILIMFLITSLAVGLTHILLHNYRILGASCNTYMLIVLSSFVNITSGKIPLTFILICLFYLIGEIKDSILHKNEESYHLGHVIGALCGGIFGFYLW